MKTSPLSLLYRAACAFASLAVLLRAILTLTMLDEKYGVYEHGAILPTVFHIFLALGCAALAIFGLRLAKDYKAPKPPKVTPMTVFTAVLTALLIAADAILSLFSMLSSGAALDVKSLLPLIVAIPAVIYLLSFAKETKNRTALALLSLFPIICIAIAMIEVYFDMTTLNTSPNKILAELSSLAAMAALLTEPRCLLEKPAGRLLLGAAPVAVVLLTTSAVPNLLFPGRLAIGATDSFLSYAIQLGFALFLLARLYSFAKTPELLELPEEAPDEAPAEE